MKDNTAIVMGVIIMISTIIYAVERTVIAEDDINDDINDNISCITKLYQPPDHPEYTVAITKGSIYFWIKADINLVYVALAQKPTIIGFSELPPRIRIIRGDFNFDGKVDFADVNEILSNWSK